MWKLLIDKSNKLFRVIHMMGKKCGRIVKFPNKFIMGRRQHKKKVKVEIQGDHTKKNKFRDDNWKIKFVWKILREVLKKNVWVFFKKGGNFQISLEKIF